MKKLVILLILGILTTTVQAQRFSFEPEIGFRAQLSKVEIVFPNPFLNAPIQLSNVYKPFWRYDANFAGSFNTKLNKRWSVTTGLQYFNYRDYIYQLENQPWPVGMDSRILANINHVFGLKVGIRYNLFKESDAKFGAAIEIGARYLFLTNTSFVSPTDTFNSVPNGYGATKVFFEQIRRQNGVGNLEIPKPYFIYLSFKPFYRISKNIKIIGSIDFNPIGDYIVINNVQASFGSSINIMHNKPNAQPNENQTFSGNKMIYGEHYLSWNFSIGLQIPLIKDKPKKPVYDPSLKNENYGL